MQHLAIDREGPALCRAAVTEITEQRMADLGKVGTNLMGTPGKQFYLHQGCFRECFHQPIPGNGFLTPSGDRTDQIGSVISGQH